MKQHSFQVPKGNIQEAIIELYLSVKIRKHEDIEHYHEKDMEKEKDKLKTANPLILIEYIKKSIEILIDIKVKEKLREKETKTDKFFSYYGNEEGLNEYEKLLRKAEADIRNYIKIEHQLKLHADALQIKNEEMEKIITELKATKTQRDDAIKSQGLSVIYSEEDISSLKKEISYLNQVIKTYEVHNLKIPALEKKLRNQKIEMQNLDSYYKTKIRSYSKKLEKYEEAIKTGYINNTSVIKINDEVFDYNNNVSTNTLQSRNTSNISTKGRTHSSDAQFQNLHTVETSPQAQQISLVKNLKKMRLDNQFPKTQTTTINDSASASIREDKDANTIEVVTKIRDVKKGERSRSKSQGKECLCENEDMKSIQPSGGSSLEAKCGVPPINKNGVNLKNIHSMMVNKEVVDNKSKNPHNSSKTDRYCANTKIIKHPPNIPTPSNTANTITKNNHIILQQSGIPCYNNINIFTNGIHNIKSGDVNLRQFIFGNKVPTGKMKEAVSRVLHSSQSSTSIRKASHGRATSNI